MDREVWASEWGGFSSGADRVGVGGDRGGCWFGSGGDRFEVRWGRVLTGLGGSGIGWGGLGFFRVGRYGGFGLGGSAAVSVGW